MEYADCVNMEPINWLYPERDETRAWREETWAAELFLKGPDGQRGGPMFGAVEQDADATGLLDRIALLTLRSKVLDELLDEYPTLIFSINVTAITLMDDEWFDAYTDEFVEALRGRGAAERVVLEIQEHPDALLESVGIDGDAFSRRLEQLRYCPLSLALDDAYSEGYVFSVATDSLDGRIVWQKMDWKYFRSKARDARDTLRTGIREALNQETVTLVVEGVETETLKGFMCEDVLKGAASKRVAIQSRRTRLLLPGPGTATAEPRSSDRVYPERQLKIIKKTLGTVESLRSGFAAIMEMDDDPDELGDALVKSGLEYVWGRVVRDYDRFRGVEVPLQRKILLPLALCGIDVGELLEGARAMDEACRAPSLGENPALTYAALQWAMQAKKNKPMSVSFAYAHRLASLVDWYAQLLSESIGKRLSRSGEEVFTGPTPVRAVGVTDQHSQVQLYVEGPHDKWFTLLAVERPARSVPIPSAYSDLDAVAYLGGRDLTELFHAERDGTRIALTEAGRPNATLRFDEVSPHTAGQYVFLMELAVALMGEYYDINAFDQRGVEAGKEAACALMGCAGYEARREEIEAAGRRQPRVV